MLVYEVYSGKDDMLIVAFVNLQEAEEALIKFPKGSYIVPVYIPTEYIWPISESDDDF
jgi:hypothetical protein